MKHSLIVFFSSPLDLTKVRLQASGDKRMIESMKKTVQTAGAFVKLLIKPLINLCFGTLGVRGLFDGISGTWLRQMSYSMCRFWAYDESKKILGAGKDAPPWKLAAAGSMGACFPVLLFLSIPLIWMYIAGGIAGFVGNPGGSSVLSCFSSYSSCD